VKPLIYRARRGWWILEWVSVAGVELVGACFSFEHAKDTLADLYERGEVSR
jgi:hypothetical protein